MSMPDITSCKFVVSDGEGTRAFTFSSVQQGDSYSVTIENDGIGPYGASVSRNAPRAEIPDHSDARVKATGSLTLSFVPNDPRVIILFTGVLHTANPTSVGNVIIASLG
jgi:hypothetical protein